MSRWVSVPLYERVLWDNLRSSLFNVSRDDIIIEKEETDTNSRQHHINTGTKRDRFIVSRSPRRQGFFLRISLKQLQLVQLLLLLLSYHISKKNITHLITNLCIIIRFSNQSIANIRFTQILRSVL